MSLDESTVSLEGEDNPVLLVTPLLPTGATLALNVCLELGINVHSVRSGQWFGDLPQQQCDDTVARGALAGLLPYFLDPPRPHAFQEDVRLMGDHPWVRPEHLGHRAVIWTRDPLDVCYSYFRSWQSKYPCLTLKDAMSLPTRRFGLGPADLWAAYYLSWLAFIPEEQRIYIRFEDAKRDPVATFGRMFDFMGVQRSDADILRAVESSSVQRSREAGDSNRTTSAGALGWARDRLNQSVVLHRKGAVGEGREALDQGLSQQLLGGLPSLVIPELGYDVEIEQALRCPREEEVFAAYGEAGDEPTYRRALQQIEYDFGLPDARAACQRLWRDSRTSKALREHARLVVTAFEWADELGFETNGYPTKSRLLRVLLFILINCSNRDDMLRTRSWAGPSEGPAAAFQHYGRQLVRHLQWGRGLGARGRLLTRLFGAEMLV